MRFDEYRTHDALGLAQLIRTRQVSRQEVQGAMLQRLHAANPQVNAIPLLHQSALDPAAPWFNRVASP